MLCCEVCTRCEAAIVFCLNNPNFSSATWAATAQDESKRSAQEAGLESFAHVAEYFSQDKDSKPTVTFRSKVAAAACEVMANKRAKMLPSVSSLFVPTGGLGGGAAEASE